MSREPTAEQIEAVARAIYKQARDGAGFRTPWPVWEELPPGQQESYGYAPARVAIAAMNAEPQQATRMERQRVLVGNSVYEGARLTWTPRHLFIEFDTDDLDDVTVELAEPLTSTPEPSITETGPEGAVNQDPPPGFGYEYRTCSESMNGEWTSEADMAYVKYDASVYWLERRLVGPPERIEE